jgi:hypothetical protein
MQITLYRRSFPGTDAPVALSFAPAASTARYTFQVGDQVYEAEHTEVRVVAPDGATVDPLRNLLSWPGDGGRVKSTAKEVFDLAQARSAGFRMAK